MRLWGALLILEGLMVTGCYLQIEPEDDTRTAPENAQSIQGPGPEEVIVTRPPDTDTGGEYPTDSETAPVLALPTDPPITIETESIDTAPPPACGDGKLDDDEACDDGNTEDGDGCRGDCSEVEVIDGCGPPGSPCHPIPRCGDGLAQLPEMCDDGNLEDGDGCSGRCQVELGFTCEGAPSICRPTVCGDGIQEGVEQCDDGNDIPFDGCSIRCRLEPGCRVGEPCEAICGDRMVYGGEQCDDGNLIDGDGCSSTCMIEAGYDCETPYELPEILSLPLVVRDFVEGHSDFWSRAEFEDAPLPYSGLDNTAVKLLSADKKPALTGDSFTAQSRWEMVKVVESHESFATWFDDAVTENTTVSSILFFRDEATDSYVNRDSPDGGFWERLGKPHTGTPRFFPADGVGVTPPLEYDVAQIPPEYFGWDVGSTESCRLGEGCNPCGPIECVTGESEADCAPYGEPPSYYDCYDECPRHNFLFTTEMAFWYTYHAESSYEIEYVGHGEIGVFMNGHLIMGMKGIDTPPEQNEAKGEELGMLDGETYEVRIFYAQRQSQYSTFRLKLTGFETLFTAMGEHRSACETVCGDGILALGEECDDGVNAGGYGDCAPGCVLGPYCGDGIVQQEYEQCDDGNAKSGDDCPPSCRFIGIL